MMAAHLMPPTTAAAESRPVIIERKVKNGRVLRYTLTVLQQPERARACGSGSKSATDRRPVDPPPVVELRIYDLGPGGQGYQGLAESDEDKKQIYTSEGGKRMRDITFIYNANFFLFATLEMARPMAHGRVQTPAATTAPVLTGMPVSGMAYLDRPAVAGYFLFPDLSVRHEGRYTLAFSLYEETKEENDSDVEAPEVREHTFDFRMEIKSDPFTVFSAKKFPGLAESTTLSRTVAEQGVRVRIRRDVRMRRRDGKGGDSYIKNENEYPKRQTRTPERQLPEQYRQRSSSATSEQPRASYGLGPELQRRPSGPEGYPAPPQYAQGPAGSRTANLNFEHGQVSQYPPPPQQYVGAQPPPPSPTGTYPSSHPSSHPSPHQPPHARVYRPRHADTVIIHAPSSSPGFKHEIMSRYLPPMKPEPDQNAMLAYANPSSDMTLNPSLPSITDLLTKADHIEPDPNITSYESRQELAKAGSKRGRDEVEEVYSFTRDRNVQRVPNFVPTHLSPPRIDGPLGSGVAVLDNADGRERRFRENPALGGR